MDGLTPKQKAFEEFILFMSNGFKRQTNEMIELEKEKKEKRRSEEIGKILERNPYF